MAYGQGVLKKDGSVIEYHGTEIKKLIVNEGVTGIGGSLCYNLPYLKSVFLPESVTKIGTGCFAECTSLQEVTLPSICKQLHMTFLKLLFITESNNAI